MKFWFLQGLPILDDGNSHNFFCALRLVVDSQGTDQQKHFPQSARTKCVKPVLSNSEVNTGMARWNELFIFEIPIKVFFVNWLILNVASFPDLCLPINWNFRIR